MFSKSAMIFTMSLGGDLLDQTLKQHPPYKNNDDVDLKAWIF